MLFAGLLDEAHAQGLVCIDTELIQVPNDGNGNVAICKATVAIADVDDMSVLKRTFSGIGDASPENVGRNIVPHIIRMAETRAKARALRDAINVSAALLEDPSTHGEEESPEPVRALPNAPLSSAQQQGYIKGLLRDLGADRAKFEGKHGAISTFSQEKASNWIEALQKRLDTKNAEQEGTSA